MLLCVVTAGAHLAHNASSESRILTEKGILCKLGWNELGAFPLWGKKPVISRESGKSALPPKSPKQPLDGRENREQLAVS